MRTFTSLRRIPGRLRGRLGEQRGAVAVLVAIMLTVFLGMTALAIDMSSFWKAQRQAQSAADAGALAAAWDLPYNTSAANADATSMATTNYPGATATAVINPSGSNPNSVKVTVNASSPSFFAGIFNYGSSAAVSASATAGGRGTVAQSAIFAYANGGAGCLTGIDLGTNNNTITGGIESDGGMTVNTNSSTHYSTGTYGKGCTYTDTGSGGTWDTPPYAAQPQDWPMDYRNYAPVNQGTSGCTTILSGNQTLTNTIYVFNTNQVICDFTGTLTIQNSSVNYPACAATAQNCPGVTFEAANIIANGSGISLSAPKVNGFYGLLFYQTGTSDLQMSANSSTLNGSTFAPNGRIVISGNSSGTGFLEANLVKFGGSNGNGSGGGNSGNGFSITGDGPPVASNGYALLQ